MSFAAAVDALQALGLELAPGATRRKFDIAHMRTLAAALGDPQARFPSILIAGTNGKGSTAATLASILAASGLRTGLYTSPHLQRVTERIRIASPHAAFTEIPEPDFARLYFHVDHAARRLVAAGQLPQLPSYFETLTAIAFLHFAGAQSDGSFCHPSDIVVLEVGLGGRLDATNIVHPILSVITDIALDHQEYLGPTIADIAREKAGILRPGGTLITLPQHPQANQAIGEAAQQIAAENPLGVHAVNAAQYLPGRDFNLNPPGAPFMERSDMSGMLKDAVIPSEGAPATAVDGPPHLPLSPGAPFMGVRQDAHGWDSGVAAGFSPRDANPTPAGALAPGLPPNHYDLSLDGDTLHVRSPLPGEHQQRNIALAIAAAIELRNIEGHNPAAAGPASNHISYNITNSAIEAGIAHTSWPGRLEFLPPNLLLDVAHNPAGAWTLRAAIAALPESQPRTLLFSCLRDKDLREMAQILFPLFDSNTERKPDEIRHHIVLTPVDSPRAASLDELLAAAAALDVPAHPAHHPAAALTLARQLTPPGGLIIATGSIYLVGALRALVSQQLQ